MITVARTDTGCVRKENQDSFCVFKVGDAQVMIVADGLGGHLGGKRASSLACDTIMQRIKEEYKAEMSDSAIMGMLRQSVNEANSIIWHYSMKETENRGMGTTVVLCFVRNDRYIILNVGDSRAYILKDTISQITVDQSYVQSLIDKGEITEEEAKTYPGRSMILQAVGLGDSVVPDIYEGEADGDLLLCSDGLTNELDDEKIFDLFCEENWKDIADRLIEEARKSGGADNITAVVAFAEGSDK